jgi:Tfp pilus assembly PilM family ATPase
MLRRRIGWIGIDIGSRSVKVAQVERGALGRLRLRQAAVIARQAAWPDVDGVGAPLQPSADEIIAAFNYCDRFRGHSAACALPMHLYGFRGLHIPPGTLEQRRAMITAALEDAWDDRGEACEFDFWETDIRDTKLRQDEPNINVLAVSRRWTDQVTQDARRSQLHVQVLDGPPLAIARAVKLVNRRPNAPCEAAVDWGFTSTTFCVVQDGRALFTRRVRSCGLRLVCESIQASLGISLEETQHLLLTFGMPDPAKGQAAHPLQQAMAEAAVEQLARFAEEVKRTLAYFDAQRRELIPERVWLLGGGAAIPGAARWLAAACDVPVKAWQISDAGASSDPARDARPPATMLPSEPLLAGAIALSALPL